MNILVTGGCGFIGSHLCRKLISKGHKVRIVDNSSSNQSHTLPEGAELMICDIRDPDMMQRALSGIECCFHLAAIASVPLSREQWVETHSINLSGTITLFEEVVRRSKQTNTPPIPILYASSAAVYGDCATMPLSEDMHARPLTPYGADKLACEHHAYVGHHIFSVPSIGFRFFNVYGPGQDPSSPYSGVISIFIKHLREGSPITIYGDGEQIRDFVHVDDVTSALITGMEKITPKDCFVVNVCSGASTSINQLADIISASTGNHLERIHVPARNGDIRISIGNPSKLHSLLGVQTKIDMTSGLKNLIQNSVQID